MMGKWKGSSLYASTGLTRVADRQNLPLMDVRLIPVQIAAAILAVDLHVYWTMYRTAVHDACGLDSSEDRVELLIAHSKTVMLNRIGRISLIEVEGQTVIDVDRRERPDSCFSPRNAK